MDSGLPRGSRCVALATPLFIPLLPQPSLSQNLTTSPPRRCQVMDEHRRAMLGVATSLYDLLQRLEELGPHARTVQRAFRSHTGRSLLALSRHEVGRRAKGRVFFELHTYIGVAFFAFVPAPRGQREAKAAFRHALYVLSSRNPRGDA